MQAVLALSLKESLALERYSQQVEQWGWRVAAATGPGEAPAATTQPALGSSGGSGGGCHGSSAAVKLLQVPVVCGVRLMGLDLQVKPGGGGAPLWVVGCGGGSQYILVLIYLGYTDL